MNRVEKIALITSVIGYIFLLSIFILPPNFLASFLGNLRFGGLISIFIAPFLGFIGILALLVEYIRFKKTKKYYYY